MFDFNVYTNHMKGKGVTIALIDTGVGINKSNIIHYEVIDKSCVATQKNIEDIHGSVCALKILETAPEVQIIDICVANKSSNITEENLLTALRFSIEKKVDIINLSLKLDTHSKEFYELCELAISKDIIIIAAADNEVSYPADFRDVIKVKCENCGTDICVSGYKEIIVHNERWKFTLQNKEYNIKLSSSFACAAVSGKIALVLEASPFSTNNDIVNGIFKEHYPKVLNDEDNEYLKESTLLITSPRSSEMIFEKRKLLNSLIIGVFDWGKKDIIFFKDDKKKCDYLFEINDTEWKRRPISIQKKFSNYTKCCCGEFLDTKIQDSDLQFIKLKSHYKNIDQFISPITLPVFEIVSIGSNSSKFLLQTTIFQQLEEKGISTQCITYNPLGIAFDFKTFEYPEKFVYPDLTYFINADVYETIKEKNKDLLLINIGGSIRKVGKMQDDSGELFRAYNKTIAADVLLLCISYGINITTIQEEIEKMYSYKVPYIAIVISDNKWDLSTVESSGGVKQIFATNEEIESFKKLLVGYFGDQIDIFDLNDARTGKIVDKLLDLYN